MSGCITNWIALNTQYLISPMV